jgi:cobalt transporter subunit CbtA
MLFRRIIFAALLVGGLSGLLLGAVQRWQVVPIINAAEQFENARTPQAVATAGDMVAGHSHGDASHSHDHEAEAWAPADGLERMAYTLLSNVLAAFGFALMMMAAMAIVVRQQPLAPHRAAANLDWRYGLLWGVAGYLVFFVAPSLGHPPEIPGTVSAPLGARQVWWMLAAGCTAAGLALTVFGKSPWRWGGLVLLALPHVLGVPQSGMSPFVGFPADVAAEMGRLGQQFVWATALANAVFWLALGGLSGWAIQRFVAKSVV